MSLLRAAKLSVEMMQAREPSFIGEWRPLQEAIEATEKRWAECEHREDTERVFGDDSVFERSNAYCPKCGMPLEEK